VISPSGTESCYISSSSAPCWITRAPREGPLPAPITGSYRCYNPSVFVLLLVPAGTQVTCRYTRILVFRCLPTTSEPWLQLWLKFRWRGDPPSTATRQILTLTEGWPCRLTRKLRAAGAAGQSRPSPTLAKSTKRIAFGVDQSSAFRLPWLRFSVIFLSFKANFRV